MKLPAMAMAVPFAAGIALGLWVPPFQQTSSLSWLRVEVGLLVVLFAISLALLRSRHVLLPACLSLCTWTILGAFGVGIAQQPQPSSFVLTRIQRDEIDLSTPLRWQGRLRDEPTQLPWGWGYELDLKSVEYQGTNLPISGGLRLGYTPQAEDSALPEIHAGDSISVFAQARLPQVFRDEGAFDRRAYLSQRNIHLVATLRAPELIEDVQPAKSTVSGGLARIRHHLREEVDVLFPHVPDEASLLRAMLLGDRSFVDRSESVDFQKTGVFHVLVVAGLHVGAFAAFLFWAGRKARLSKGITTLATLLVLISYVAVIEQRPPVLRAALMASVVILGGYFFRRLDLLNSAAVAALILLVANPLELRDSSFQLSFLAIGCIAGLGVPWLDRTVQPYANALRGWRDVTRDAAYPPKVAQFRIDLRSVAAWLSAQFSPPLSRLSSACLAQATGFTIRLWELFVLTIFLQIGMLPMMAADFHRVTLTGPVVNLIAVPLTGLIVPLGFLTLLCSLVLHPLGALVAQPLHLLTAFLLRCVQWFAHFPKWSYRVPGPPHWLIVLFFALAVILAVHFRVQAVWSRRLALVCGASLLAVTAVIAIYPFSPKWTPGSLELTVLDVGQGDSLFLVLPEGHTLLIDGGGAFAGYGDAADRKGPDPGEDAVSPYLWSRGFQRLDVVALTHAHLDHAAGLSAILENFKVGALWLGREVASPVVERLEVQAGARHIPILHQSRSDPFVWDGVQFQFLWPDTLSPTTLSPPQNDDSLVLHLRYGNRTMLLPGDAEKSSEQQILEENAAAALLADVLKVGHHGSRNSTTPAFLSHVRPRLALISTGKDNPYGHPNPELLTRLEVANVPFLRTDENGAIHILTDGHTLRIFCFLACPDSANNPQSVRGPFPQNEKNNEQQ